MFNQPDRHLTHRQAAWLLTMAVAVISAAGLLAAGAANTTAPAGSFGEAGLDDPAATYGAEDGAAAYENWERPPGPLRVGLQAGHWKADEAPDELENIRSNGAYAAGKAEWQVNLEIVRRAASTLEKSGIVVDILPATVPPGYLADAFVSVHADDSPDHDVSGYKVASPYRDLTKRADWLAVLIAEEYSEATDMQADPNVTENMQGYYAFNWRRYEHAIHPMTPAALLETGFLTNARDRKIIVRDPQKAADALSRAILRFLGQGQDQNASGTD